MAGSTDIQRLVTTLEVRFSKMEKELAKASAVANKRAAEIEGRFARMNRTLTAGAGAFASSFTKAFAFAGIGVGIAAIPKIVGDIVDEASGLVKTADLIGVTTDRLQEFHYAAKLADVDLGDLDKGLEIFGRNIGEASRGQGDLGKVLAANGVALRDQAGNIRSASDLLYDYADLVKNAGSEQEALTLATIAFGRGGADFINFLKEGSGGLRKTGDEAHRVGAILGEDLMRRAEAVADDWTRFTTGLSTDFKEFVLGVVNGTADVITKLDEIQKRGGIKLPLGITFGEGSDPLIDSINAADAERFGRTPTSGKGSAAEDRALADMLDRQDGTRNPFRRTVLPPGGGGDRDAAAEAIKALQFQAEQLDRTAREQAIYNELNRAGVEITSEAGQKIAALAGGLYDHEEALKSAEDAANRFNAAMEDFGGSAFDALMSVAEGASTAKDALTGLIKELLTAEARSQFIRAFNPDAPKGPLSSILSGLAGGFGGGGGFGSGGMGVGVGQLYAGGGRVSGPGSGTSDSVLARLSNGEYVVNAKAADRYGALLEAINGDTLRGFARGGRVGGGGGGGAPAVVAPVQVHVHAAPGINVSASRREDGGTDVRAELDAAVARLIDGGRSTQTGRLLGNMGLKRPLRNIS